VARAAFAFDGPIRSAVHRLKFSGWRDVALALGGAMASAWDGEAEVATWVPLSSRRRRERGFDQARALARVVGPRIGLPLAPLLQRRGDPSPQARRGRAERLAAMRDRFSARDVSHGRVLLVDDVLTTGATAAACAQALVAAGAREVSVLTAARALPGRVGADILGDGLAFGSVVAPGNSSPAVDASRGRNDPRKATLGR
jgi:predicted amidophosphoribosyltransferase